MLHINFKLEKPIRFVRPTFKVQYENFFEVSQNKMIEISFSKVTDILLIIGFNIETLDHAGLRLCLGLLGYQFNFDLYDTRHWEEKL